MDNANVILEMPQQHKVAWLAALRSGKYEQTSEYLCSFTDEFGDKCGVPSVDSTPQGFCCLGVLVDVIAGREALIDGVYADEDNTIPVSEWYKAHGMESFSKKYLDFNPTKSLYPPKEGSRADTLLTTMNDGFSYRETHSSPFIKVAPQSFLEIADYIEANVRGV